MNKEEARKKALKVLNECFDIEGRIDTAADAVANISESYPYLGSFI